MRSSSRFISTGPVGSASPERLTFGLRIAGRLDNHGRSQGRTTRVINSIGIIVALFSPFRPNAERPGGSILHGFVRAISISHSRPPAQSVLSE